MSGPDYKTTRCVSMNGNETTVITIDNTQEVGKKNDNGKPRLDLIPAEFLIETAKALTYGGNLYGEYNFRKGIDYSRLLSAAKRHIELELAGLEKDKDSGHSHLGHAAASLAMYAFMKVHRPEFNNLFKYTEEEKKKIEEMMYGEKK